MPDLFALDTGQSLPSRSYSVDQTAIDLYAHVSGDNNPLHTDPDFAAETPFGRRIAHGMMTLCFLSDAMEAWAGDAWRESGALDVAFLAPVYPGDTVTVTLQAAGHDCGIGRYAIDCATGERTVLAGEVRLPLLRKEPA